MAQLPSVTPYNVQLTGVGGATTPGVSFGAQRRPDIAYQAQAQYQQTLSKTLDRISGQLFGFAEKASERAGLQFVADNPTTPEQLKAMVSGEPLTLDFTIPGTAFGDAVNKARAIELSAYAEVEGQKLIETLEAGVAMNSVTALDAMNQFSNFVDGVSSSLANQTPDASFKFRASMATIGRSFINNVAGTQLKRIQEQNKAVVEESYRLTVQDIARDLTKEVPDQNVYELIEAHRQKFAVNALPLVGTTNASAYEARFNKDILEIQQNMAASYVASGTDPYKQYDNLRLGRTGNSLLDSLTAVGSTTRTNLLDAARKELSNAESLRVEQEAINKRKANDLEAQFAEFLSVGDKKMMQSVLSDVRTINPVMYTKLLKDFDNYDSVFAVRDDGAIIADLERRLNNPYGEKVTVNEIYSMRKMLTQSSFVKYINAAKAMDDEQIRLMVDGAASRLGMMQGAVINSNALRQKNERIISELKSKFQNARRNNPEINPLDFLDENFEKTKSVAGKASDAAIAAKVTSRTYKTIAGYEQAIGNARKVKNFTDEERLTREMNDLQDAIDQGLVDATGKVINRGQ